MVIEFTIMKFLSSVRVSPISGIANHVLKFNGPLGTLFGLLLYLFLGGGCGLLIGKFLERFELRGIVPGASVGFSGWFVWSILVGTIPVLDFFVGPDGNSIGPMGIFAGAATFYVLLLSHAVFGGWIGLWNIYLRGFLTK